MSAEVPCTDPAASASAEPELKTILLTGATGYVGGRLLHRLQDSGRHRVRCLTRRPEALVSRAGEGTEVVAGDVLDRASLWRAMEGVDVAC
jgi:uncharacterized protein YbjT (DUF2867 family)